MMFLAMHDQDHHSLREDTSRISTSIGAMLILGIVTKSPELQNCNLQSKKGSIRAFQTIMLP